MKQFFWQKEHENFKKYFWVQAEPWETENMFYEKSRKYLKKIAWIPGIRMIGIWNSIGMNSASKDSDIDLYIVTTKNSLWFVRIIITFIFQLLWVRKTARKHAGQFCLSFFSTEKWMDFKDFALENDIYLYFWILYFTPLISYNNSYEQFIETNSSWADFGGYQDILETKKSYIFLSWTKKHPSSLITLLNTLSKKIFLPKTLRHCKKLGKPYGIIISNDLLKFHDNDIRKEVRKKLL